MERGTAKQRGNRDWQDDTYSSPQTPPFSPLPETHKGKLPFDIYDQALGVYGNDAAKLILNCDANILKNTAPHPSQRIRSVSLLETLRPLRETVELARVSPPSYPLATCWLPMSFTAHFTRPVCLFRYRFLPHHVLVIFSYIPSPTHFTVSLPPSLPFSLSPSQETGDEAMSLRRCLSWVSDRDARSRNGAGRGSGEEFTDQPDTDMLLMWAEGQGPGRGTIGNGGRSR